MFTLRIKFLASVLCLLIWAANMTHKVLPLEVGLVALLLSAIIGYQRDERQRKWTLSERVATSAILVILLLSAWHSVRPFPVSEALADQTSFIRWAIFPVIFLVALFLRLRSLGTKSQTSQSGQA